MDRLRQAGFEVAGSPIRTHLTAMPTSKPDTCPLCAKPSDPVHQPFCSRGCKDRDLLNWLGEGYRVPGPPADDHKHLDSEL